MSQIIVAAFLCYGFYIPKNSK